MRRWLCLTAVAMHVLALVGCGAADVIDPEEVAQAAVATSETRSMRIATQMEITMPGSDASAKVTGEGALDNAAGRAVISMDLAPLAGATGSDLGKTTTVMDGTQVYMKLPFLQTVAPDLKPWIKVDLQEAAKEQGVDVESLLQLGRGGDPSEMLAYLRAAGEVEEVGTEEVRGVATTHHSAVVDLQNVPELSPEESRERIQASIDQLIKLTGKTTQPIDVWIDGEGLVRRMSVEQTVENGSETSKTTTTIELYDFNSEVSIEVPPAEQVSNLKELMPQPD